MVKLDIQQDNILLGFYQDSLESLYGLQIGFLGRTFDIQEESTGILLGFPLLIP